MKQFVYASFVYSGYPLVRDKCLGLFGRAPIVVLCYHRIGGQGILSRTPKQFESDLKHLKQNYDCISLSEFCERVRAKRKFRHRSAVVTFDDGYKDNFTTAVPLLRRYSIPATFFVTTGFIGNEEMFAHDKKTISESEARYGSKPSFEILSWEDLRKMQEQGFEIGSHTVSHSDFSNSDVSTIQRELKDSLATLQKELGNCPRAFAFPWGTPAHTSEEVTPSIRDCGYYAAVTMLPGTNTRWQNLYWIKRVDAGNGNFSALAFQARVAGLTFGGIRTKSSRAPKSQVATAK